MFYVDLPDYNLLWLRLRTCVNLKKEEDDHLILNGREVGLANYRDIELIPIPSWDINLILRWTRTDYYMSLLPDFLAEEDICYSFSNVPEQKMFFPKTDSTPPFPRFGYITRTGSYCKCMYIVYACINMRIQYTYKNFQCPWDI